MSGLCRFLFWEFHDWGKWGDPELGYRIHFNKRQQETHVQERTCSRCNKRELREAR